MAMTSTVVDGTISGESLKEYRLLAESIPNLAWIAHADGSIYWYNQRWYEYTGTTPKQMQGWGWQSVHDPLILPDVLIGWQRSIQTEQSFEMTFPLRGADGLFRPFLTRVVPMRDEGGRLSRWFGTNTDVGVEHRAVAQLRESEQRFRTATAAVSDVLWTNDAHGEMRGEQLGWAKFTGQTYADYQGHGWASALHPEDAQATVDAWLQAVREERLFCYEHRVRRYDGVYRLCSIRALPIKGANGNIREWVGVHTDITAQRQAEAALRQSDKLAIAGRLAASIAHEINNPLDAVGNLLHLLQSTSMDGQQLSLCQMMQAELRRVADIANHTLKFSRQSGAPGRTLVEDCMHSALGLFAARLRSLNISVDCRFHATRKVLAVEGELRQVIANLIGNAIDAMATGTGKRVLSVRTADVTGLDGRPWVTLTIADTGEGMADAVRSQLFDPFVTTKGEKGTGLGLWISHEIVLKHNGKISVRSSRRKDRQGTTFRVGLPVSETSNGHDLVTEELRESSTYLPRRSHEETSSSM